MRALALGGHIRQAITASALLAMCVATSGLAGQLVVDEEPVPEFEPPTEVYLGLSPAFIIPRGDGFRFVSGGPGVHAFIGFSFLVADEIRFGGFYSAHPDDLPESRTRVLGLYMEVYWAWRATFGNVRVAPRVAWVREFRSAYDDVNMNQFGLGAVAGAALPLTSRISFEPALGLTHVVFDSEEVRRSGPDLDGVVVNWIWEVRLGVTYRVK